MQFKYINTYFTFYSFQVIELLTKTKILHFKFMNVSEPILLKSFLFAELHTYFAIYFTSENMLNIYKYFVQYIQQ